MAHVEIKLLVSIFAGRIVMERGKKCRWFSCWTQQFSIPTDYQRRVSKSQLRFESNLIPRTLPNKGFWWVFNIVKYIVLCMKCNVVKTMPCLPPIFLGMVTIPPIKMVIFLRDMKLFYPQWERIALWPGGPWNNRKLHPGKSLTLCEVERSTIFEFGKSTISIAIFTSYVKLPEGTVFLNNQQF